MSSRTFVCWTCRIATRADPDSLGDHPRCARCEAQLDMLSEKIRIPRKGDARAWRDLQEWLTLRASAARERMEADRVRRIHDLENQIAVLQSGPETVQRTRHIRQLQERLRVMREVFA